MTLLNCVYFFNLSFFSKTNISSVCFSSKTNIYPRFVFQAKLAVRLFLKHLFRLLIHLTALKVHL